MQARQSSAGGSSPLMTYQGIVLQSVRAITEVANGGQVLMDMTTANDIARLKEQILSDCGLKPRLRTESPPKR